MFNKLSHKKLILVGLIVILLLLISILTLCALRRDAKPIERTDRSHVKSQEVIITITPTLEALTTQEVIKSELVLDKNKLDVGGWMPTWASQSGYNSLTANPSYFDTISPVWYEVRSDGSLNTKYPSNRTQILSYGKTKNIRILPTVGMFDHNLFSQVLQSPTNLQRHVDSIVSTVVSNGYQGIDLDYESVSLADKELYYDFLSKLSSELHRNDKILIVTVLAKWGDNVRYSYRPETRQVQDWALISKYADEVRIMAYDYTYSGDKYPGPIGPTGWINEVLEYASQKMPPEKTVLGIHLYAYEWYQTASTGAELELKTDSSQNTGSNPNSARAYTYRNVLSILQSNQGESSTFEGENVFFYTRKNDKTGVLENRALVYISPNGVKERMLLAQEYNLKGVVFWRLGDEGGIY
ncbi:MAG TPA: glycosyl hydrolase family 18 protein [Candidatus Dojkabacteria bacterium]|nr:glycosyl hydrolase family 18 protein [Candidatus Dojkabacteria bacterium]